jgi:hypothetical protein
MKYLQKQMFSVEVEIVRGTEKFASIKQQIEKIAKKNALLILAKQNALKNTCDDDNTSERNSQ